MKRFIVPAAALVLILVAASVLWYRMRSNETSAKGSLIMLASAVRVYAENCHGFPAKLAALNSNQGCRAFSMVDDRLASGHGQGYDFVYAARDGDGDGSLDSATLEAVPTTRWLTGRRSFSMKLTGSRNAE